MQSGEWWGAERLKNEEKRKIKIHFKDLRRKTPACEASGRVRRGLPSIWKVPERRPRLQRAALRRNCRHRRGSKAVGAVEDLWRVDKRMRTQKT